MTYALPRPRTFLAAIVGGVTAGVTIVVCLTVMDAAFHVTGFSLARFFAFAASTLVGNVAYSGGFYVGLGVALHFAVAIGWALGYAIIAERQAQLLTRPLLSGAAFGLIVYFAMQLVIVGANLYHIPTPGELGIALLAHMVFYGIPVALIVARLHSAS